MVKSVRTKITLWFSTVLLVILMVFSTLTYFILKKSLISSVDSKLRNLAVEISKRLIEPEAVFLQFVDKSGSLKPREEEIKYAVIPISLKSLRRANKGRITFETIKDMGGSYLRVITYPVKTPGGDYSIVQIATPIDRLFETMRLFVVITLLTIPISVLASALGGIFITDKVLSPIKEITQAARRISSENLGERLEIRNPNDEIGELAKTFNDMIERLEKSFLRVKEFSADASHELKTPLTTLKGEIEVALLRDRSKEEYKRILKSALEEIDRLTKVVNDLLTLSKGEMGKLFLKKGRVKVEEVIAETVSQIYSLMEEKRIEFSMDIKGDDTVLGDRNLLKQLFLNLIENAVKYNVEGGSIKVSINGSNGWVSVKVEDTGIGIPEDEIPRIFEKFYRVEKSRARDVGGSGLGLSIAKWIVDAHGGRIKVKSKVGEGTVFEVFLPKS